MWGATKTIEVPAVVIGEHNGSIDSPNGRNAVLVPLFAIEAINEGVMTYIKFNFEVDPAFNRELGRVREEMKPLLRKGTQSIHMRLDVFLRDEELQVTAGQMEQTLNLMKLLYPAAIAVSMLIGATIAVLLILQSIKIAAILRVLGSGKRLSGTIVFSEHLIVAVTGLAAGVAVTPLIGIELSVSLILPAGLYILAVTAGAVLGAFFITRRAPLELLQVRE